ncbi:DUF5343 domain-containing protein [Humidesulfovibrio sp.]
MGDFPSTQANAKFKTFFAKIPAVGTPPRADIKWLKSHGFTSSNDRGLLTILMFLGFIDAKYAPTERWTAFRGKDGPKVLGIAITEAYKELYEYIPEAHKASRDDLQHFFRPRTNGGDVTVQRQVLNFVSLSAIASFDFEQGVPGAVSPTNGQEVVTLPPASSQNHMPPMVVTQATGTNGLTINLNVQLTLPDTADEKLINQIFAAMGKHLLKNS